MMKTAMEQLPSQETGRQTDFIYEHKYDTLSVAHRAFRAAAGRLLSVNHWHAYSGGAPAKFTLCNNQGAAVEIMAGAVYFISIDLPGPDGGGGLEWVIIEKLVSEVSAHTAEEYLLMIARPAPGSTAAKIAHFYEEVSTSTFIVRRDGMVVSDGAHGRNEKPNNEEVDLHDKIRNMAIALMARVGLSGGQWQKLVDGLIGFEAAMNVKKVA